VHTEADGANTTTSYSGVYKTVTDQAGKAKQYEYDSLQRVITAVEDPGGLNYTTIYRYDTLDNLTLVQQGSQARNFGYDSLKRETSAANPESGTVTYDYDNAGNLTYRRDGRQIVSQSGYDELNRLNHQSFTDGTPDNWFVYDDGAVANSKGRLTAVSKGTAPPITRDSTRSGWCWGVHRPRRGTRTIFRIRTTSRVR